MTEEIPQISQQVIYKLAGQILELDPYTTRVVDSGGGRTKVQIHIDYSYSLNLTSSVARLEGNKKISKWAEKELKGYEEKDIIPDYRYIDFHTDEAVVSYPIPYSVYFLENWLRKDTNLKKAVTITEDLWGVRLDRIKYVLDMIHRIEVRYASEVINKLRPPQEKQFDFLKPEMGEMEKKYDFSGRE